jgi:hypothetical protein
VVNCISVREAFEESDSAAASDSKIAEWASDMAGVRAWERMRMVYPYLQLAYLAAQAEQYSSESLVSSVSSDEKRHAIHEAVERAKVALADAPDAVDLDCSDGCWDVEGVPFMLRVLVEENPEVRHFGAPRRAHARAPAHSLACAITASPAPTLQPPRQSRGTKGKAVAGSRWGRWQRGVACHET